MPCCIVVLFLSSACGPAGLGLANDLAANGKLYFTFSDAQNRLAVCLPGSWNPSGFRAAYPYWQLLVHDEGVTGTSPATGVLLQRSPFDQIQDVAMGGVL